MCCMQLAKNSECKNSPSAHHRTTSSGYIFARHVSTIGKNFLNSNIMSLQYNELQSTNGRDRWQAWGTPSKFQRVSHLGFVTAPMSLNQTLHDIWPSPGLVHHIYIFRGLFPPNGILPGAKFTLLPSLAFSCIDSVTAQHSNSGRQPDFVARDKEGNYRNFASHLHQLYSTVRPSRWASAHILVS